MNAVEIADAVTELFEQPLDPAEFPFQFLEAFGEKATTIKRLRGGSTNHSDLDGGLLQRNRIHLAVASPGKTSEVLARLLASPATTRHKCKYALATDGDTVEAQSLLDDDVLAVGWSDLPGRFGFFLPLAGITTVRQISESSVDIHATNRLNKLYVELLSTNPQWGAPEKREDLNHFLARLIFCYFAEDTRIFHGEDLFTNTLRQMTEPDGSNFAEVLEKLFAAMNTKHADRGERFRGWADTFPYVNGGLFGGSPEVPRFTKIARSYALRIGELNWQEINPDIFGSMIQAVADDEERGALGMHYTSVPNILKVLNPLFLDSLRERLDAAGDNPRKLLNLRKRLAHIRVFDPACGSGNFLVIAYKQMRDIEAEVNRRRNEGDRRSEIPLTNFRGIELRHFAAEVARLALLIAEYQCDEKHRGPKLALAEFLPLDQNNWITRGNALQLDWAEICPPAGKEAEAVATDLLSVSEGGEADFENEGGETYICGNPPYKGARKQKPSQKSELKSVFDGSREFKDADYIIGWFLKAAEYFSKSDGSFSFVSTSSIAQGEQVQILWPRIWAKEQEIGFAYTPFKWSNNAANNAGVHVVIVGVRRVANTTKTLYDEGRRREVENISPYIIPGGNSFVCSASTPISSCFPRMVMGNMARDDGNLIFSREEGRRFLVDSPSAEKYLVPLLGTKEIANGPPRLALHLKAEDQEEWSRFSFIRRRVDKVRAFRAESDAKTTRGYASIPHRFAQYCHKDEPALAVPSVVPNDRLFVTPLLIPAGVMVTNLAYVIYEHTLDVFSIISSTLHVQWNRTVSGRHGTGPRYTPTISYHTFPVPPLTEQNREDLSACAEGILLAREAHFPATIAELYDPDAMPEDLRAAHDRNDETLERIYVGRRFKNDTERLEHLFARYTAMTA